jgi:hypothetical protein
VGLVAITSSSADETSRSVVILTKTQFRSLAFTITVSTAVLIGHRFRVFPHASRHGRVRRNGSAQAILIMCADGAGWCEMANLRHDVRTGQLLLIPP